MSKINYLIVLFFILSHCSTDTKSGVWENKNSTKVEKALKEVDHEQHREVTYLRCCKQKVNCKMLYRMSLVEILQYDCKVTNEWR